MNDTRGRRYTRTVVQRHGTVLGGLLRYTRQDDDTHSSAEARTVRVLHYATHDDDTHSSAEARTVRVLHYATHDDDTHSSAEARTVRGASLRYTRRRHAQ
jgi:hypothetical protein